MRVTREMLVKVFTRQGPLTVDQLATLFEAKPATVQRLLDRKRSIAANFHSVSTNSDGVRLYDVMPKEVKAFAKTPPPAYVALADRKPLVGYGASLDYRGRQTRPFINLVGRTDA